MDKYKALYHSHREMIAYLFFGALTTAVSILSYALLSRLFALMMRRNFAVYGANFLSILLSVTFAYITNRRYVFQSKASGRDVIKEMASFYLGRAVTMVLDMALMALLVSALHVWDLLAKALVTVVVIALNYIISKLFVFKTKENTDIVNSNEAGG